MYLLANQLIYFSEICIGKWKKSKHFHFLLLSGIGRWTSQGISISLSHGKNGKRSRFFPFLCQMGKQKKDEKFPSLLHTGKWKKGSEIYISLLQGKMGKSLEKKILLLCFNEKWEKVKKFLLLSSAAKRCIIIITPLATIIRIVSPSLSFPSRNHCISELQRIHSGTGIIIKTNYYFYYYLHFHICYGNLR